MLLLHVQELITSNLLSLRRCCIRTEWIATWVRSRIVYKVYEELGNNGAWLGVSAGYVQSSEQLPAPWPQPEATIFRGILGQTATKLWIKSPASTSMLPYQRCRAWTVMITQNFPDCRHFPTALQALRLIIFSLLWWTVCTAVVETCVLNCSLRVNEGTMIEIVSKATAFSQSLSLSFVYLPGSRHCIYSLTSIISRMSPFLFCLLS